MFKQNKNISLALILLGIQTKIHTAASSSLGALEVFTDPIEAQNLATVAPSLITALDFAQEKIEESPESVYRALDLHLVKFFRELIVQTPIADCKIGHKSGIWLKSKDFHIKVDRGLVRYFISSSFKLLIESEQAELNELQLHTPHATYRLPTCEPELIQKITDEIVGNQKVFREIHEGLGSTQNESRNLERIRNDRIPILQAIFDSSKKELSNHLGQIADTINHLGLGQIADTIRQELPMDSVTLNLIRKFQEILAASEITEVHLEETTLGICIMINDLVIEYSLNGNKELKTLCYKFPKVLGTMEINLSSHSGHPNLTLLTKILGRIDLQKVDFLLPSAACSLGEVGELLFQRVTKTPVAGEVGNRYRKIFDDILARPQVDVIQAGLLGFLRTVKSHPDLDQAEENTPAKQILRQLELFLSENPIQLEGISFKKEYKHSSSRTLLIQAGPFDIRVTWPVDRQNGRIKTGTIEVEWSIGDLRFTFEYTRISKDSSIVHLIGTKKEVVDEIRYSLSKAYDHLISIRPLDLSILPDQLYQNWDFASICYKPTTRQVVDPGASREFDEFFRGRERIEIDLPRQVEGLILRLSAINRNLLCKQADF